MKANHNPVDDADAAAHRLADAGLLADDEYQEFKLFLEHDYCKKPCEEPILRFDGGLWEHNDARLDQDHMPEPEPKAIPTRITPALPKPPLETVSVPYKTNAYAHDQRTIKPNKDYL